MDIEPLQCFKALADESRVRVLNLARHREMNVSEIVEALKMGQSRVSRHLKILADTGLVVSRRDGTWVLYRVPGAGSAAEALDSLEPLLDAEPHLDGDRNEASRLVQQSRQRTQRFFDSVAPHWDDLKADIIGDTDLSGAIMEHIGSCGCAADLGCGTGDLLTCLLRHADHVVGVDSSAEMLARARERFSANGAAVDLRIGEIEHLPMRDGEADFGVLNLVLHHLADPAAGIAEAARVLAPGSVLVITDFVRHTEESMRSDYGDRWLGFSQEELGTWFSAAGLVETGRTTLGVKRDLAVAVHSAKKS